MLIIGLTGSIGMGKSTVAARFSEKGLAVCDADQVVHDLYAGAAAPLIEKAFPGTTTIDASGTCRVDRHKLGAALTADPAGFKKLESIVHPLVRAEQKAFLHAQKDKGATMAVLEIPLLFETGAEQLVDAIVVVSAPADIQRARVLERPGMSGEKFDTLLGRQLPDEQKRRRADFIVDTSGTIEQSALQVDRIIAQLKNAVGKAYDKSWT